MTIQIIVCLALLAIILPQTIAVCVGEIRETRRDR